MVTWLIPMILGYLGVIYLKIVSISDEILSKSVELKIQNFCIFYSILCKSFITFHDCNFFKDFAFSENKGLIVFQNCTVHYS